MRLARIVSVVVIGMLVLTAAGCGGEEETGPARPIQTGPAATSTTAAATAGPRPVAPGPLEPGTYETVEFRPKLSFTVGEDWGVLGDAENGIALAPRFDPAKGPEKQLTFTAVKWVFDDPLLTDKELATNREDHIRPAPRDLERWLRANRYLEVGPSKPARLGGVRGVQFDVRVKDLPGPSNCQQFEPNHCVLLFPITRGANVEPIELVEVGGSPSRYTLVEAEGTPVLVTVGAPADQFEDFLAEAGKVLRSVTFA